MATTQRFLPVQTSDEFANELIRRNRPWTKVEYEAVRTTATALIRSHKSCDGPNGVILTCVDGPAFWALMGALDRVGQGQPYGNDDV